MEERQTVGQIANEYIDEVKEWLLNMLEQGRVTRKEYEMQCNRLVEAQGYVDMLLEAECSP